MDPAWLEAANHAIDTYRNDPVIHREIGEMEVWQETDCTPTLRGDGLSEERLGGSQTPLRLEALPHPHCDPFRRMIAHPEAVSRLNWMLGPGWTEGPGSASVNRAGAGGQQLHAGRFYGRTNGTYYRDGAGPVPVSGNINMLWCLRDVHEGDGGFVSLDLLALLCAI